ncbi:hypothetical protein GGI07_004566 [Coemansia sp. Benny D115]|nr:hypothetical protein GGI07_004566 [Coemansia sp. Benny D115]
MTSSPSAPMPAYFVSHGGPNLLDDADYPPAHPVSQGMRRIGQDILAHRPRAMLVVSAHWQSPTRTGLQINTKSPEPHPLIYDFGGFADWLFREQFAYTPDPGFSAEVADLVRSAGISTDQVDRGFDHGVWVVLKKAGLDNAPFPIVQMSLFAHESMPAHVRLGEILEPLRHSGVVIVGSGMAVHNLRDLFTSRSSGVRSYVDPFDKEIEAAVLKPVGKDRNAALEALEHSDLLRRAHPSLDHLLPLHVAAGAATGASTPEKLFDHYELSLSWSCYKLS